jgi:hypothetical protein
MAETALPYQVVIFTQLHSISGVVFLRDQRLSDYLNDRREKNIMLRNAKVARLANPTKVLERTQLSIIPKSSIVLAFEPPQKIAPPVRRFIKYSKQKYEVFIIMDGMDAHGEIHVQGTLDLLRIMADSGDSFLPITQASVSIEANPVFLLQREAVIINTQCIRFIGEIQSSSSTEPLPNPPPPKD